MKETKEQLLEAAREKLRWYALEAEEGEFDEDEVDLLVKLINKLEQQPVETQEEQEERLERFRAYVDFYREDEAARNRRAEEEALTARKGEEPEEGEKKLAKKAGRILHFPGKRGVIVAAVCLVLLIAAGGYLGEVNADENTGFFHWLKKDKEGVLAITSPTTNGVGINDGRMEEYYSRDELPAEYAQYIVEKDDISLLKEYELQSYLCAKASTFIRMKAVFANVDDHQMVDVGVVIYPDKTMLVKEKFDDYEFLHSDYVDGRQQDVFMRKEDDEKTEYMVLFYCDNRKFFVSGEGNVELLKAISGEYMELIFNNN